MKKGRTAVDDREDNVRIQEFLDMIAPSVIKFETDHFICGNTYRWKPLLPPGLYKI